MAAHYDLIVIGSDPAGEKGAAQAAYFGKKVAVVERTPHLGGTSLNTGTVPSKALRETALYFTGLRQRGLYGIDYSLRENLTVDGLMYRKQQVVANEWEITQRNLDRHHIEVVWGEASLADAHTVQVRTPAGERLGLEADVILIATGSSPSHPEGVPFDHPLIYDSDSILQINLIPKTMVVVGGGAVGCEYASIFTALGVQVTLVDARERLLPCVDSEIAERLQTQLEQLGLRFLFNDQVVDVKADDEHVNLTLQSGKQVQSEMAVFATGRTGNVEGLGLEAVGVQVGKRALIVVNDKYQTAVPHIYAAGDVIGSPALASTSMEQARVAMVHAFDLQYKEAVSPILPTAVYTIPEIAMVGLSEDMCKERNILYLVGRSYYEKSPRGQIIGDMSGMLKLIFSPVDKRVNSRQN